MNQQPSIFEDVDLVFSYTRDQALADGVLIDVTKMASEAGISFPVAVTSTLWDSYIVPIDASDLHCQSIDGRLWDTLWLFRHSAAGFSGSMLFFVVPYLMKGRRISWARLKAVCGPGDTPDPVITIMLPEED